MSCPGTSNFLAINIWPRKIHLPPSQPQLLSSPPYLIPHNPAVKPRHGRWRPSTLPQTTTLGRADHSLAFEVPCKRDVVGLVSRLIHSNSSPRHRLPTFSPSHSPIYNFRISNFEIPPPPATGALRHVLRSLGEGGSSSAKRVRSVVGFASLPRPASGLSALCVRKSPSPKTKEPRPESGLFQTTP